MSLHLSIVGTGSYLPEEVIPNSFFEGKDLSYFDRHTRQTKVKQITASEIYDLVHIGERRRSAEDEWPVDLGLKALKIALEDAKISPEDLTGIIVASVTQQRSTPSVATEIQKQIGARNCVVAYDISNACAGFPMAIIQANALASQFPGYWGVVAAECLTRKVDYSELSSFLFGDAGGAAVLRPTDKPVGVRSVWSNSNPFEDKNGDDMNRLVYCDDEDVLRMHLGHSVMACAERSMVGSCELLINKLGWDHFGILPHQSNGKAVDRIGKKFGATVVPVDRELGENECWIYKNVGACGNTSAAGAAVALDEARKSGYIKSGTRVLIPAVGSGIVEANVAHEFE